LLREVYINLLDIKEPKFNLSSVDYNEARSSTGEKSYNKTIVKISEEELKKHKQFLKSEIKKNFY
jgi:DNA polymerase-3 subunit epsilon